MFNIPLNAQAIYPNDTVIPDKVTAFGFSVGKRYYEEDIEKTAAFALQFFKRHS